MQQPPGLSPAFVVDFWKLTFFTTRFLSSSCPPAPPAPPRALPHAGNLTCVDVCLHCVYNVQPLYTFHIAIYHQECEYFMWKQVVLMIDSRAQNYMFLKYTCCAETRAPRPDHHRVSDGGSSPE